MLLLSSFKLCFVCVPVDLLKDGVRACLENCPGWAHSLELMVVPTGQPQGLSCSLPFLLWPGGGVGLMSCHHSGCLCCLLLSCSCPWSQNFRYFQIYRLFKNNNKDFIIKLSSPISASPHPNFAKSFFYTRLLAENTSSLEDALCNALDSDFQFKEIFHLTFLQIKYAIGCSWVGLAVAI